ncbi:MAG: amidohydrolase family protein [Phycisphaerales bacterium]
MIIDVHTHLNNYHEERVRSIRECLDNLQGSMEKNGIDYALVLTSYKVTEHRPSTASVIEAVKEYDNLFVVAGISYLHYKERDLREISDYLRAGLVKGLKMYPGYEPFYPYDPRCTVIYDLAKEYDVPVMFHTGDTYSPKGKVRYAHPLNLDDVAVDHPEMKIVACHIGNPWIRDCMEVVYKNKNVWADISGLVLGDFEDRFEKFMLGQIREMIMYAGEPRYLLYGTDWPISSMESYRSFMNGLELSDKAREMIMWKNAAKLFKIDVGQPVDDVPDR